MLNKYLFPTMLLVIGVLVGVLGQRLWNLDQLTKVSHTGAQNDEKSQIHSNYAGQENRSIKALSPDDVEGLLNGSGTPFGGMAKPAELNGYPGPRHVLDASKKGEITLSSDQVLEVQKLYKEMRREAVALGEKIIDVEQQLDDSFANKTITEDSLQDKIKSSAVLYSKLRTVHLKYHLVMVDVLDEQQIIQYNQLRGYDGSKDPCASIPEGHDPKLWKLHNNCA